MSTSDPGRNMADLLQRQAAAADRHARLQRAVEAIAIARDRELVARLLDAVAARVSDGTFTPDDAGMLRKAAGWRVEMLSTDANKEIHRKRVEAAKRRPTKTQKVEAIHPPRDKSDIPW